MSETKRESGYYWVLTFDNIKEAAYYSSNTKIWFLVGTPKHYQDINFKHINETKLQPPA